MKDLDEFGSVLAIAGVILAVCAAADGLLPAPGAGSARVRNDYAASVASRSLAFAGHDYSRFGISADSAEPAFAMVPPAVGLGTASLDVRRDASPAPRALRAAH